MAQDRHHGSGTADLAEAWRKQVGSARKKAEEARVAEKKPHDEAAKAVQKKWLPVIEAFDRLDTPIRAKLTDFAVAQRERIRKEQEAAREAGEASDPCFRPVRRFPKPPGLLRCQKTRVRCPAASRRAGFSGVVNHGRG